MKILLTGSSGFIGGYLVEELLRKKHTVIGIDNYSKYGPIKKKFDNNTNYRLVKGDVKDTKLLLSLIKDCDHIVACAAKIGGIGYFNKFAYDIISENEKIISSTFDAAIEANKKYRLKKITVISSSMVFESTKIFPTPENAIKKSPPPKSTYGFQKLSCEYFAKGAWEQYKLPYTIIRPFNCVGIGESRALSDKYIKSGNIKLAMSHVVPDLIQKTLKKQYPLHILGKGNQIRHFTYGGDIAKGIILAMFSKKAKNEDFNISSNKGMTMLYLARQIHKKIYPNKKFSYVSDKPFMYDVQKRIPDTTKAEKLLGFKASVNIDQMLDELIPWIREQIKLKKI